MPSPTHASFGPPDPRPAPKDAPYFFDLDIDIVTIGERQLQLEDTKIEVRFQLLDEQIWLAECFYTLPEALSDSGPGRRQTIQAGLGAMFEQEFSYTGAFIEEYTILLLRQVEPAPDAFVDRYALTLAQLLRSFPKSLTDIEVNQILGARIRYSQHDLTIVDWEGAIIIAEAGDFQSDLELLKIGNYQLLRYRLLDRAIERSLQNFRQHLHRFHFRGLPSRYRTLQQIIEQRLTLLLDFEKIDQSLLLIGDWYSAQVYRQIVEQFYLDHWKALVGAKLDTLAATDEIVREHLTFSWGRFLDLFQIIGWFILLIGYFILFFADLGWLK